MRSSRNVQVFSLRSGGANLAHEWGLMPTLGDSMLPMWSWSWVSSNQFVWVMLVHCSFGCAIFTLHWVGNHLYASVEIFPWSREELVC